MQVAPIPSPPVKEENDRWETEEDRASWLEFLEANKTLNFEYMMDNQPFEQLPWQYFPKPMIDHHPPIFVYGFPLKSDVSEIEHIAHLAGILKPEEPLTGRNVMSTLPRTMKYLAKECGLSRENSFSVDGCYCRTVRFVLKLKTNYKPGWIPPEKLEHVIGVLKRYLPGKSPQWFLDPDIVDTERRNFEIPVEALLSV